MCIVSIENLNYFYGKKQILKEVKLDIDENKLTGIIGPNGCGKSTLAKNIIKYLNGDFKKLEIMNTDIKKLSHKKIAQLISYIPQHSTIISNISVFDYILLGRFPLLKNSWNNYCEKDFEIVNYNINLLNIAFLKDRNIETLSGGELQKVLLARALVQEADIYLMDEPFQGVDSTTEKSIVEILKQLKAEGKTIIVVHHDLQTVPAYFESVALINKAVIVSGKVSEVFTQENIDVTYRKI